MNGPAAAARLRELLAAKAAQPAVLAEELRAARLSAQPDLDPGAESERIELELLTQAARQVGDGDVDTAVAAARVAMLDCEVRRLAGAPLADAAALFDLVELAAQARQLGVVPLAHVAEAGVAQRIDAVAATGVPPVQEAIERAAALTTGDDELPIRGQLLQLRGAAAAMRSVGERMQNGRLRRTARRLDHQADDRELLLRLQGLLGVRGHFWLETTSVVLLGVVLVSVLIDMTLTLTPAQQYTLYFVDGCACLWFVAEFAGKLVLVRHRVAWFLRNALLDLLPAIPAALWLLPEHLLMPGAEEIAAARVLRLLRIAWLARTVQWLRPLLQLVRLLLLLVRGMDGLVRHFAPLLDRDLVFFEPAQPRRRAQGNGDADKADLARDLFRVLRREHLLLAEMPATARCPVLVQRARELGARLRARCPAPPRVSNRWLAGREVRVEDAIAFLNALAPEDLHRWLLRSEVAAIDRVVRVASAPVLRWLPVARRLCVVPLPPTAEQRVVGLGRRFAAELHRWNARITHVADLHGIVTGPQLLDRVASAIVRISQRPAVRLLLFGSGFTLLDLLFEADLVQRFVGTPLLILGSICMVVFALGWWLKRIAGEAADAFRLASEAQFLPLMHLRKRRHVEGDLLFLARRVFAGHDIDDAVQHLRHQFHSLHDRGVSGASHGLRQRRLAERAVLLYEHFLGGSVLHESDQRTTEQLLANMSIENLRVHWLRSDKRDRKRLRQLRLDDGSLLRGPFLWFRFITESIAVETAKCVAEYNRHCLTRGQQAAATPAERQVMADWLQDRRDVAAGRSLERTTAPGGGGYRTTEFTALDFADADPQRDARIEVLFGNDVLTTLRIDRERMMREVFGTRPLHRRPRSRRVLNPLRYYQGRLSHGRVLLAPLLAAWRALRFVTWVIARMGEIVREITSPERAARARESGRAPFAVALRKIHRMKAPGLLEAIRLRALVDPAYCGAPVRFEVGAFATRSELEHDLDFLQIETREAAPLLELGQQCRRRVQELQGLLAGLGPFGGSEDDGDRAVGELAVIVAYVTDTDDVRTLLGAQRWLTDLCASPPPPAAPWLEWWRDFVSQVRRHPIDALLDVHGEELPRDLRPLLLRACATDRKARRMVQAWARVPRGGTPAATARANLAAAWARRHEVQRELVSLRTIQTLAVLDVRNYRELVFEVGNYAADGEDPAQAQALP